MPTEFPSFDPKLTPIPNGTTKDFYNLYNIVTIDPTNKDDELSQTYLTTSNGESVYPAYVGQNVAVTATLNYQKDLEKKVADRAAMNKDINDHLNYTMMSMAIWVPLGIFAGYYLYSRGATTPTPSS